MTISVATLLSSTLERVVVSSLLNIETVQCVCMDQVDPTFYMYRLTDEQCEDRDEDITKFRFFCLPSIELEGVWESLIFDHSIKQRLLDYVSTGLLFSSRGIDANLVNFNRLILLHGEVGTGKTSLSRALAHKISIRFNQVYTYGKLIEINSHSLFSKYFSESGKLVQSLFDQIKAFVEDSDCFVTVLIDEVESLTASRESVISGAEPSDAVRVVNSVLTQLDAIKKYPNILILATSNILSAIDPAFIDRADLVQYIGPPNQKAAYRILLTCMKEFMSKGLLYSKSCVEFHAAELLETLGRVDHNVKLLWLSRKLSKQKTSARTLRKLFFNLWASNYVEISRDVSDLVDIALTDQ